MRILAVIAGIVLVAMLIAPNLVAAETCAKCGKTIEGSLMRAGKLTFHPRCFTCAVCGRPIEGEYVPGGKAGHRRYYHDTCYRDSIALHCSRCGTPIDGNYYPSGRKSYCPACYQQVLAPHCVVCGLPIMDVRYTANEWDEPAHSGCRDAIRPCDVCGHAMGGALGATSVALPDGREICAHCAETGLIDANAARPLFEEVAREIAAWGIQVDPASVGLDLCGKDRLRRLTGRRDPAGHTEVQATFRGRELISETLTVHILDHLAPDRFAAVAGHELTHVYLHHAGRPLLPHPVEEGFCNYIASLVLSKRDTELSRHALRAMDEDPDPDYGVGYRRVRTWVKSHRLSDLTRDLSAGTVPPDLLGAADAAALHR